MIESCASHLRPQAAELLDDSGTDAFRPSRDEALPVEEPEAAEGMRSRRCMCGGGRRGIHGELALAAAWLWHLL